MRNIVNFATRGTGFYCAVTLEVEVYLRVVGCTLLVALLAVSASGKSLPDDLELTLLWEKSELSFGATAPYVLAVTNKGTAEIEYRLEIVDGAPVLEEWSRGRCRKRAQGCPVVLVISPGESRFHSSYWPRGIAYSSEAIGTHSIEFRVDYSDGGAQRSMALSKTIRLVPSTGLDLKPYIEVQRFCKDGHAIEVPWRNTSPLYSAMHAAQTDKSESGRSRMNQLVEVARLVGDNRFGYGTETIGRLAANEQVPESVITSAIERMWYGPGQGARIWASMITGWVEGEPITNIDERTLHHVDRLYLAEVRRRMSGPIEWEPNASGHGWILRQSDEGSIEAETTD